MNPLRTYGWGVAATAAVLAAAAWLRWPSPVALGLCAAATVWCAVVAWRSARSWHRIAHLGAMLAFTAIATRAERQREVDSVIGSAATAARSAVERDATARIVASLDREIGILQHIAAATLDAPRAQGAAFPYLDALRENDPRRAVALVRSIAPGFAAPVVWSGRMMVPMDSLAGPVGVVGTPFYLAVYAIAGRGDERAIAATLVHVERPADDLATALDASITAQTGVDGFEFRDPVSAQADSFAIVSAGGVPLLGVRSVAPPAEVLAARAVERGRILGGLALAVALAFLLSATWGQGRNVRLRLAALVVALVVIAMVPLTAYSNASPVFDPATYHVASGGPFTTNIAALALTSAIILAALLATIRSRIGRGSRRQAAIAVFVVAVVGPFVLRDLARGMQFPQNGAETALWLGWEAAIFLASVTVLIAGIAAGRAALGRLRGVPPWVAVLLALVAALMAPALIESTAGFPPWYPAVWVLAIGALALSRRTRGAMLATAFVAACGAVTLVWGQSLSARVALAEHDVEMLEHVDSAAAALLSRFTTQLDPAHTSRSKVELLARYAASDLSAGEYPVELTAWDKNGRAVADLRVAMGSSVTSGLNFFAREARGARAPILRSAPGGATSNLVLSVPHADSTVTTVVVGPRSRLLPRDAFGALVGVGAPANAEPPYALTLTDANAVSSSQRWTIKGSELHRDWYVHVTGGRMARVHAHVEVRGYSPVVARGVLLVIVDLALLGALWVLLVVADGAFGRWFRLTRRHWLRSYRGQLTVVLFAFFALPAAAFVFFSYRRLDADDRQSRDLLVRETLRGVAAATNDSTQIEELAARFDTPLFLFANGVLVRASDPMLEVLAPTGRFLPEEAARALAEGDEASVSAEVLVGTTPIRFGFRGGTGPDSTVRLVLAAPARTDDLALDRRRRDLGVYLLFAIALGALAALWLSGRAARQFSRPIGELQHAALALASGEHEPALERNPPAEFEPVFSAFRRMARDLEAGRAQEATAQRVLAWGEMARQVAHEIKNPLTPMRLGVQHLRRARHDPRVNFDEVLEQNVARLLAEIDRLDEIARAFSRYGTVPAEQAQAEPVDVAQAVRDVVELEQLGAATGDVAWSCEGADAPVTGMARATELREVLLNLLENARLADAKQVHVTVEGGGRAVTIRVRDDGGGIAADVLPRIFEPHFSTRTSGSGLGLAISRRLIEGWGGTITVESLAQQGTTVRITLVPAAAT